MVNSRVFLVIALFGALLTVETARANKRKCLMTRAEGNECGRRALFVGDKDFIVPQSIEDTKLSCDRIEEGVRCMQQYANCIPNRMASQLLKVFMRQYKRDLSANFCNEEMRTHIFRIRCTDSARMRGGPYKCFVKFRTAMQMVRDAELNMTMKLPGACCAFQLVRQCMVEETEQACGHTVTAEVSSLRDLLLVKMMSGVSSFCLPRHDSVKTCNQLYPDMMKKFKQVFADEADDSADESVGLILADIIGQISENDNNQTISRRAR